MNAKIHEALIPSYRFSLLPSINCRPNKPRKSIRTLKYLSQRPASIFLSFPALSFLGLPPGTVVGALRRSETLLPLPEQPILSSALTLLLCSFPFQLKNNGHIVAKTQVTLYASVSHITKTVSSSTIKSKLQHHALENPHTLKHTQAHMWLSVSVYLYSRFHSGSSHQTVT